MRLILKDICIKHNNLSVLNNFNFELKKFDNLMILGSNGSGKTSLIKTIIGLNPYAGEIFFEGLNTKKESYLLKKMNGVILEESEFPENLRVDEYLDFVKSFYEKWNNSIMSLFKLNPSKIIKELSRGEKQKLKIILALSHEPKNLIMDEPLQNLDFESEKVFLKLLKKYSQGKIIISTHHPEKYRFIKPKKIILK